MSTTQPRAAPAALPPAGWATLKITHDGQHAEAVAYGPQIMMDRLRKWLDRYFAMLTTPATVAGQCEYAIAKNARAPLSAPQIAAMYLEAMGQQHMFSTVEGAVTRFTRAVEKHHGITAAQKETP